MGRTAQGNFLWNEKTEKVRFFLEMKDAYDILKGVVAGIRVSGSEKRLHNLPGNREC